MPPDPSAIDSAVLALLQGDTSLALYMPDGVWMDEAPQGSQRFVIVSVSDAQDSATFGARAFESITYLVKAVQFKDAGANDDIRNAAKRIDLLLENAPLTVAGYAWMTCHREQRVRFTEVDDVDVRLRWYHRGGRYRVEMSLTE